MAEPAKRKVEHHAPVHEEGHAESAADVTQGTMSTVRDIGQENAAAGGSAAERGLGTATRAEAHATPEIGARSARVRQFGDHAVARARELSTRAKETTRRLEQRAAHAVDDFKAEAKRSPVGTAVISFLTGALIVALL